MKTSQKGIDVAQWNHGKDKSGNLVNSIDWEKVKNAGVEFVIIKAINKQCEKEKAFDFNYDGAISEKLPVDVYNYSYASNVEKAIQDAQCVVSVIKGKSIEYVWLDLEEKAQMGIGTLLIDIINAYQKVIVNAGFKFGVYTGLSFYNSYIKPYRNLVDCPFWMARYPSSKTMNLADNPTEDKKPEILHTLWGWQYTSTGNVDGISGNVDLSFKYGSCEGNNISNNTVRSVLKKGSSGKDVAFLQMYLRENGYYTGGIDGKFGNITFTAVKTFQTNNGLTVDGIVGSKTWNIIESGSGKSLEIMSAQEFSLISDGDKNISENFKVKEFRCKDGSDKILIDAAFVKDKLQAIRDHFGAPVTINSAYRTEAYNKKVGGAKSSYHMKGQAFDIVVKGKTPLEVAQYAQTLDICGIIQYNSFVHVDSRSAKYWARNDNGKVTVKSGF